MVDKITNSLINLENKASKNSANVKNSLSKVDSYGSENSTSATRGHGIEFGGGATVHCWLTGYTSTSSYLPTYLSTSYMSNGSHTRIQGSATYFTNA